MNEVQLIRSGKYISLLLRHKPEVGGVVLDEHGWCEATALIEAVRKKYNWFDFDSLEEVVAKNNKQRFAFDAEKKRIRANQGHSVNVDVELKCATPPDVLFHGSATKFKDLILQNGIVKGNRLYVHLSKDIPTAISVGKRHGEPVVFQINTKKMIEDGHIFYLSENGVWLTDNVPTEYINIIETE